ncbi:MAG TPA: SPOR domain-containing protein [Rhodocyclaceae bacterium]|jgi:cell division protein FtsN|nr:SPOR domain-containing protein [Rhodocyclaceae bacterium]
MNRRNTREQRGSNNSAHRSSHQAGNTLVGVFVGLVLGVVIAAGVVWYLNRSHSPFQDKGLRTSGPAVVAPTGTTASPPAQTNASSGSAPDSLPAKPGDKQRFDFYNILPGGSDTAPAPNAPPPTASGNAAANSAAADATVNDQYFLQAGAFQNKAEADNLKARLALIGIDSSISEVAVPDKGKMYRVRSGPYAKADAMNLARTQMSQGGIQATVVKTAKN